MGAIGTWANSATGPGNWSDSTKWTGGTIPGAAGDTANFNLNYGTNNKTITIDTASRTVGTMNIGDPGVTYWVITITGGSLIFDNSGSAATLTKSATTNTSMDIISSPVSLVSNLTMDSTAPGDTAQANSSLQITGAISGPGGITKNGTGAIWLTVANSYAGGTVLNAGKLHVGNNGSLGAGTITFNGGELVPRSAARNFSNPVSVAADFTAGVVGINNQLTFSGPMNLGGANRTITTTDTTVANDLVISGGVSNGGLIKAGAGTLQLGGTGNTYTGPTTVNAGVLNLTGTISDTVVSVASGATLTQAITGVIGGASSLSSSGTATLAGTNTYTGATTVTAGTLSFSALNPIDASSGVSINGPTAKLVVGGTGTMVPPVTLTQGALDGDGTINTLTVANSVANTISAGNGSNLGLLVNSLTFQGAATLNVRATGQVSDQYIFAGNLSTSASGQIVVNLTNTTGAWTTGVDYPVIDFDTYASSPNASHFTLGTMPGLNPTQSATLINTGSQIVVRVSGDVLKWTGLQNSNWTTQAIGGSKNWSFLGNGAEFTNGSGVSFDDSASNFSVNLAENVNPGPVIVESDFNDYSISSSGGFGIQAGSLTKSGESKLTLSTTNAYTGTTTINGGILEVSGTGSIAASSAITNNAQLAFNLTGATNTYANPINGSGSLTKSGMGTLTLTGANTFAGGLTLDGGTLNLNSAGALGTGTGTVIINGGTLNNSGAADVALSSSKPQTWNSDFVFTGAKSLDMGTGVVTVAGADAVRTVTVSGGTLAVGEIKAPGQSLTKEGPGTLAFASTGAGAASSVLNGVLTVNNGTVQINRTGAADINTTGDFTVTGIAGTGTITNGSGYERWLFVNTSVAQTFSGLLTNGSTGALGLVKQGAESLTLNTANTYTGPTNLETGNLVVQNGNALGSGVVNIRNRNGGMRVEGNITVPNNLVVSNDATTAGAVGYAVANASGNNVLSGNISLIDGGGHALFKSLAGSMTLSGNVTNVYTAVRNLILGGDSNEANSVSGVISNGAAAAATTGVNKVDAGTWTLAGANTYTGATSVAGGILRVTGTLGNTAVTVTNGTLSLQNAGAISQNTVTFAGTGVLETVDNAISGTAGIVVQQPLTLSTPNNYSGQTTLNAGTSIPVTVTNPLAAGTGSFFTAAASTTPVINLHINGGGTINMPVAMGGNSGVTTTIDVNNNGSGSNGLIHLGVIGGYANGTLNVTGGNGYNLSIAGFLNGAGAAGTATLNPTTANLTLGSYTSTSANAKVLRLDGTSTGNSITGIISDGTAGTVSINKTNSSTWTLSGANTYKGSTTVTQGTLSLTQPSLDDASAVVIVGAGAVLNLAHSSTDQVASLSINGQLKDPGVYDATTDGGFITGTGKIRVGPSAGYSNWAAGFPFTPGVNDGAEQDADGDGINNVLEYVLGGIPVGPGSGDASILPAQSLTASDLVLTFRRSDVSESDAVVKVQWSTSLTGTWNDFVTVGPVDALPAVDVTEDSPTAALDTVVVKIPRSNGPGGKLFGRVVATKN